MENDTRYDGPAIFQERPTPESNPDDSYPDATVLGIVHIAHAYGLDHAPDISRTLRTVDYLPSYPPPSHFPPVFSTSALRLPLCSDHNAGVGDRPGFGRRRLDHAGAVRTRGQGGSDVLGARVPGGLVRGGGAGNWAAAEVGGGEVRPASQQ